MPSPFELAQNSPFELPPTHRAKSIENARLTATLFWLIHPGHTIARHPRGPNLAILLLLGWLGFISFPCRAQNAAGADAARTRHVLLLFSEARDLPGNVSLEQSVKSELLRNSPGRIEFFTESMDASHFPSPRQYSLFRDYIKEKYAGQNLDLAMFFMGRDFMLTQELPVALATNVPMVFVAVNELTPPALPGGRAVTGIFQRFNVRGTLEFIFQLQPETRRVVIVGGLTPADRAVLARIQDDTRSVAGVDFEFWTNQPMAEIYRAARVLPPGTVILASTIHRDTTGQPLYTSQVVQALAATANVPVYVLNDALVGSGALGGYVVNFEDLGTNAADMATRILAGQSASRIPIMIKTNGGPMVDWSALQRWSINPGQLPAECEIRFRPHSPYRDHWALILVFGLGLLAQAITIAAMLVQRRHQHRAEAEILRQRTELAHVARVSMMGQLATALTHELNQPLGAILRNAEAAEIYLQNDQPDLKEIRAILTDIRRDDKRAGNVIDRMRSLFRRQKLTLGALDLLDLVEDTIAMARPDAAAREVKLKVEIPPRLPAAQGDRVHVQQILLNLILNGMDAMQTVPRSRRLLVIRVVETLNGNLQASVTDCGSGIEPDNASHIFEPFFTTKASGMGMGLAISKTIIEAHGGEIWVRSNAMEGTTFTFLLPPAGLDKIKPGDLPTFP